MPVQGLRAKSEEKERRRRDPKAVSESINATTNVIIMGRMRRRMRVYCRNRRRRHLMPD